LNDIRLAKRERMVNCRVAAGSFVDFSFQQEVGAVEFKKFSLRFSEPADVHDAVREIRSAE